MNALVATGIGAALACAVAVASSMVVDLSKETPNDHPTDSRSSPANHEASRPKGSQQFARLEIELKYRDPAAQRQFRQTLREAIAFIGGAKSGSHNNTVEQAFAIVASAAERDDLDALRSLARAFRSGTVLERDLERAFGYEVRAADLGDEGSAIAAGFAYVQGKGVSPDPGQAIEYLKMGIATKPHAGALKLLGDLYNDRTSSFFSLSDAKQYYLGAAELGDPWAFLELGKLSEESREADWYSTAHAYYQDALALGNQKALRLLGRLHLSNETPIRDMKSAADYFLKAARAGDVSALSDIALMQKNGEFDSAQQAMAIAVLEERIVDEEWEKKGRKLLGDMYRQKGGPGDQEQAVKNYMRAGELGDGWALLALGDLERGSPASLENARKHYADAAAAGVVRAYVRLGDMAWAVKGGSAEPSALTYYRLAEQKGDPLGRLRVARALQSNYKDQSATRQAVEYYKLSLTDIGAPETIRNMLSGDRGGLVAITQTLLIDLGYGLNKVDGLLGKKTIIQIKKFCKDRGLPHELFSERFLEDILTSSNKSAQIKIYKS